MQYISHYQSPLGEILLAADELGLTGLWFAGQKYFAFCLDKEREEKEIPLWTDHDIWGDRKAARGQARFGTYVCPSGGRSRWAK